MGKYRAYESYKDSGVEWLGEIPEHWENQRFKFLLSEPLKYGANEAAEIDDPTFPRYIRITDVKEDGTLREDTFRSLPEAIAQDYLLEEGDILLARSGATVGKTFIYRKSWGKAAYAGYLIRARISEINYSNFIYNFLQSSSYWDWVNSIFIQATIQNISAEKYANFSISIPSLEEQKTIARFLDYKTKQIDALIAKKEALLEKLDEKRTALISHAVTKGLDATLPMKDSDIEWLREIPKHWEASKLGYLSTIKARLGWKGLTAKEYVDNGYIFLATPNIKNESCIDFKNVNYINAERYFESPEIMLQDNDVLLVKDGSTLGIVNIIRNLPSPATVNSSIAVIRTNNKILLSEFLFYWLNSFYIQSIIQLMKGGQGVPHLYQEDIKRFSILIPAITEQKEIVEYVDQKTTEIDAQKAKIQQAINLLKEYRTALITNAVTGKIDVRQVLDPP